MERYEKKFKEGVIINAYMGVPVGEWTFLYTPKNKSELQFLVNSANARRSLKPKIENKSVVIAGGAEDHSSLIDSLQSLDFDVVVDNYNYGR